MKKRVNYKGVWYKVKIEQDDIYPRIRLYILPDKWYSEYDINKKELEKFDLIEFIETSFDEYYQQLQEDIAKEDSLKSFFLRIKNELKDWDGIIE